MKTSKIFIGGVIVIVIAVIALMVMSSMRPNKQSGEVSKSTSTTSGKIILRSGDCMPNIGGNDNCKTVGVSRKVYIYPTLYSKDFSNPEPGSSDLNYFLPKIEPIIITQSSDGGEYSVNLPDAEYSIFAEDNGKLYCNHWGGNGEVCKITLKNNTATPFDFTINHATD